MALFCYTMGQKRAVLDSELETRCYEGKMVDKNDFLRNIVMAFSSPNYNYNQLYRYVDKKEFEKLFRDNEIIFTNPRNWKGTDYYETYFEEWWLSKKHLLAAYRQIKRAIDYKYNSLDIDNRQLYNSFFSQIVACIALLQQKSFCYCLADNYIDRRMVSEYHEKYGRNIVIKYKPCFFQEIATLGEIEFVLPGIPSLYADIFPMYYIDSFEQFIASMIEKGGRLNKDAFAKSFLDLGAFLKHSSFKYEHEVRMKLKIMLPDDMNPILISNIYNEIFAIDDEDKIVDICMRALNKYEKKFNSVYDGIKDKIILKDKGKEYFILNLRREDINRIIESILIYDGISNEELVCVTKYCDEYNLPQYKI